MPGLPFKSKPEEHPAISAFLSPKSRIFAGGHAHIATKQLTPEEVAQKIASMLKPGPPFFSKVSNADLLDFISDQSIMNSEALKQHAERNRQRQTVFSASSNEEWDGVGTVWSALDSLPAGSSWAQIPGSSSPLEGTDTDDDGLWSSLILTVDVNCTKVSVGKSVVVPTQVLKQNHFYQGNQEALTSSIGAGRHYKWDDLRKIKAKKPQALNYLSLSAYTDPQFSAEFWKMPKWMPFFGNKDKKENEPIKEGTGKKRVWIPSTTEVSLHASWWGYNIYLPSSILASLDDDVEQAEKIANLINTCLNYIVNNIPAGLPTALEAIVTILKAIAPTTGYISTFIGWSWDTIKSFDKGQGIVLSATWILPVALIPRAWDAPITKPVEAAPVAPAPEQPSTTAPAAPVNPLVTEAPPSTEAPLIPPPVEEPTPLIPPPVEDSTPLIPAPIEEAILFSEDPEDTPIVRPAIPVPAPGATLPPSDPAKEAPVIDVPNSTDTSKAVYPGNKLGRGGETNPQPAMGNTPPPGRVPIDADS